MNAQARLDEADVTLNGHNGTPTPARTLYYSQGEDMEIHLVSTVDRMRLFLKLVPGPAYKPVTAAMIGELVRSVGASTGLDESGIGFFAALQNSPSPYDGYFQLARGESMHRGEDGYIEFHVQPSAAVPRYDQTDSGGIDFKQLNLLENCFAGQRVATIIPPGNGRPGVNVFGEEIPAQSGKAILVQPGPGVIMSANGRDFSSEIEGRLVHEGNLLSVSPVLEIAQDIDYGVGNIDFVGKVVVNGSVLDGFNVRGKRGIEIKGDVGSARISSDGDVSILGGIQGKNAAVIECAGLKARYVDNAAIDATGDVVVDKEILHSTVKTLGKVSIDHGSIIGGEVWGFQGVEAETLGSELGVATSVVAGLSWTDENVISEVRGKIAEYGERVRAAGTLLAPLLESSGISAKLSLDQKSMISDLVAELRVLRDNLAQLVEEKERIVNRRQAGRVCQINVQKTIYMGVNVRFPEVSGEVKDAVKGPASIIQDGGRNTFRITGFTRLAPEKDEPAGDAASTGAPGEG